jgi:hypothetical protein
MIEGLSLMMELVYRYSLATKQFLFGTPSQYRNASRA